MSNRFITILCGSQPIKRMANRLVLCKCGERYYEGEYQLHVLRSRKQHPKHWDPMPVLLNGKNYLEPITHPNYAQNRCLKYLNVEDKDQEQHRGPSLSVSDIYSGQKAFEPTTQILYDLTRSMSRFDHNTITLTSPYITKIKMKNFMCFDRTHEVTFSSACEVRKGSSGAGKTTELLAVRLFGLAYNRCFSLDRRQWREVELDYQESAESLGISSLTYLWHMLDATKPIVLEGTLSNDKSFLFHIIRAQPLTISPVRCAQEHSPMTWTFIPCAVSRLITVRHYDEFDDFDNTFFLPNSHIITMIESLEKEYPDKLDKLEDVLVRLIPNFRGIMLIKTIHGVSLKVNTKEISRFDFVFMGPSFQAIFVTFVTIFYMASTHLDHTQKHIFLVDDMIRFLDRKLAKKVQKELTQMNDIQFIAT